MNKRQTEVRRAFIRRLLIETGYGHLIPAGNYRKLPEKLPAWRNAISPEAEIEIARIVNLRHSLPSVYKLAMKHRVSRETISRIARKYRPSSRNPYHVAKRA